MQIFKNLEEHIEHIVLVLLVTVMIMITCSTNTSGIANVRKTYQDNGGWSAQVFYKDVNGKTKGKKFYFSTYGEDRAIILATEYVTQMKKLITEERTRLEQLKESMYGVC